MEDFFFFFCKKSSESTASTLLTVITLCMHACTNGVKDQFCLSVLLLVSLSVSLLFIPSVEQVCQSVSLLVCRLVKKF